MTRTFNYYQIVSPDDVFTLGGSFDSKADALSHINYSFNRALELGYNNSHEEWLIVLYEKTRVFNDEGVFQREQMNRDLVGYAKYSPDSKSYVLV